jgi:RNA-binding protein
MHRRLTVPSRSGRERSQRFAFAAPPQYNRAMLTGKQRRYLRSLGHPLSVTVQLGRGGITEGVVAALDRALVDHELIKVKVAEAANLDRHQAAEQLAGQTRSEIAQVLGNTVLLYRRRDDDPKIELP